MASKQSPISIVEKTHDLSADGSALEHSDQLDEYGEYEIAPGCPDWGTPGKRRCYECGEPVDEIRRECTGHYDDPLAAVLGKCQVCGAPNYEVFGKCPDCGGPVYMFTGHFACYNTTSETCDFRISINRMEELDLIPCEIDIKYLLDDGLLIIEDGFRDVPLVTHAQIVFNVGKGWDVKLSEGPLPKDRQKLMDNSKQ